MESLSQLLTYLILQCLYMLNILTAGSICECLFQNVVLDHYIIYIYSFTSKNLLI